jgi:hypothetical protein
MTPSLINYEFSCDKSKIFFLCPPEADGVFVVSFIILGVLNAFKGGALL